MSDLGSLLEAARYQRTRLAWAILGGTDTLRRDPQRTLRTSFLAGVVLALAVVATIVILGLLTSAKIGDTQGIARWVRSEVGDSKILENVAENSALCN